MYASDILLTTYGLNPKFNFNLDVKWLGKGKVIKVVKREYTITLSPNWFIFNFFIFNLSTLNMFILNLSTLNAPILYLSIFNLSILKLFTLNLPILNQSTLNLNQFIFKSKAKANYQWVKNKILVVSYYIIHSGYENIRQ